MKKIISNNIFAVKILFGAAPVLGIYDILAAVFHIVINFCEQTVCVYLVLHAIETRKSFGEVLIYLVLIVTLSMISTLFFNLYHHYAGYKFLPIVQQALKLKLYNKAKEVDISCYDNTEYYNNFVLSVSEADNAVERAKRLVNMVFSSAAMLIC